MREVLIVLWEADDWRRSLGVFAVERFIDADHVRDRSIEVPPDFTMTNVLHGAFGNHAGDAVQTQRIVIEFSHDKARWYRRAVGIRRRSSSTARMSVSCSRSPARTSYRSCRGSSNGDRTPA